MPLLKGTGSPKRESLYFHYPNYAWHKSNRLGGAIRRGNYKLIENFDDGSIELYNLADDIGEKNNLAEKMSELAKEMRDELAAWREKVGAKMPTSN